MNNIDKALKNMDDLIALCHKKIETLEEMKTALRITKVWPDAWKATGKVRVTDHYDHTVMAHPVGNKRPQTEELRQRLYNRIKSSARTVGRLTDGTNEYSLSMLEFAYIKGYVDQLEDES